MFKQHIDISAIYPDSNAAQRAVRALTSQGVDRSKIILIDAGEEFEKPVQVKYDKRHREEVAQVTSDGLAKGAVVGSFGGLLLGLGIVTLPAIAPALAVAGVVSSVGAGAAVGGLTGGLFESLAEVTMPEDKLQNAIETGHVLLVARVDMARQSLAEQLLEESGALTPQTVHTT